MPWRTLFFAINFSAAVLAVVAGFLGFFQLAGDRFTPMALVGGSCFAVPAIAFGAAEWCLYVRGSRRLERPLGVVCGAIGAFALFGLISNAVEAVVHGRSPGIGFWLGFGAAAVGVAAYCFWCAWYRWRQPGVPEARGFPVVQSR